MVADLNGYGLSNIDTKWCHSPQPLKTRFEKTSENTSREQGPETALPARADSRPLRHRHHPSPTPNCLKFPAGSFRARPLVFGPARSNKAARDPIPRPRRSARFFGGARFHDMFLGRASAPRFAHTRCFSVIDFVQNYYPERLVSIPLRPPSPSPSLSLKHIHAHEQMYRDADTFASRGTRTRVLSRSRACAGAFKHTHAGMYARSHECERVSVAHRRTGNHTDARAHAYASRQNMATPRRQ